MKSLLLILFTLAISTAQSDSMEKIHQIFMMMTPPGTTVFSDEVVENCDSACQSTRVCNESTVLCEKPRFRVSDQKWVRYESKEAGSARFWKISEALDRAARNVLCLDSEYEPICKSLVGWEQSKVGFARLVRTAAALAIAESGLREDVMTGRGSARKEKDGGRGRGPGGEACFMQLHPVSAWRVMGYKERPKGDYLAHPDRGVLGERNLERCFRFGMIAIARAAERCGHESIWKIISYYGTGTSCTAPNDGKTDYRYGLYLKVSRF